MITKVEVRNSQGDLLSLTLSDPTPGLLIQEIGGLGPVKANLVSSSFARLDGETYQSARREARDISFKIDLRPDYVTTSVSDLRDYLYEFFMPKAQVFLRFFRSSGLYVDIGGKVETFDPQIFTEEPQVDISIRCFNPDFIDPNPVVLEGSTVSDNTDTLINYTGTIETGILFTLNVDRDLSEFSIYHTPPDGSLRTLEFATPLPLVADDVLQISTIPGSKFVILTRSSSESSLLYGISPQSNWIEFIRGTNAFRVYAEGAAIPYTVQYTNKYGGL